MRVVHVDKHAATKKQIGSDIFIVPTDDEKLKIVIIPLDVLHHKPESGDTLSLTY